MSIRYVRRRDFIATLGGAAAWPIIASAQRMDRARHIGVLISLPAAELRTPHGIDTRASTIFPRPPSPARAAGIQQLTPGVH